MKCMHDLALHDYIVTSWKIVQSGTTSHKSASEFLCRDCLTFMSPEDIRNLREERIRNAEGGDDDYADADG